MIVYKNANFWIRLLSNLIDFFIVGVFVWLIVFLLTKNSTQDLNPTTFITLPFLVVTTILIYWFLIPFFLATKTIGQWICQLKVIDHNNAPLTLKQMFTRIVPLIFMPIVSLILVVVFFDSESIKLVSLELKNSQEKLNNIQKIGWTFIGSLSSLWIILTFVNFAFMFFSKRKLSLIDFSSNTRVVLKKEIIQDTVEIIIQPTHFNKREIIYKSKSQESDI